jgi:hypothetical protein
LARNVVSFIPSAEAHAKTETERKQQLYDWAVDVLIKAGLADQIMGAADLKALNKIIFDPDNLDIALAIRDALHPVSGKKADFLTGLHEGTLKRIMKNRFDEMKKIRADDLRNSGGSAASSNWMRRVKYDKNGNVRPILFNLSLYLRHHQNWVDVLGYDEFAGLVTLRQNPPWGEVEPDTIWSDYFESMTRAWFQEDEINAGLGETGRAVQMVAQQNKFHPVRDYLEPLRRDAKSRADTFLIDYFGCPDTPFIRAIGRRWLISAVARVYDPGCQVDHAIVLEGPQGKFKSTSLRALAVRDEWFADRLSHIGSKDAAMETHGIWIIEFAEMDVLSRGSSGARKAFITRQFENFRPPYGKHKVKYPRQCVFSGTINPPADGRYLDDETGGRRIWPAPHGEINRDGIIRDRDLIWAEAVELFKAGEPYYLETKGLEALAKTEQLLRLKAAKWNDPIKRWVGRKTDISLEELAEGALGIKREDLSQSEVNRIVKILTSDELGFVRIQANRGHKRSKRYTRSPQE